MEQLNYVKKMSAEHAQSVEVPSNQRNIQRQSTFSSSAKSVKSGNYLSVPTKSSFLREVENDSQSGSDQDDDGDYQTKNISSQRLPYTTTEAQYDERIIK